MAKLSKGLTDLAIKKIKFEGKDIVLSDGDGLQLRVRKDSKTWLFRYRQPKTNKVFKMTLGKYPALPLTEARKLAMKYNEQIALGIDPKEKIDDEKQQYQAKYENTFENIALKWFEIKKNQITPSYADDIWRSFELHVLPHLARTPIDEINAPNTIEILRALEARGSLETVKRLCQRLNEVMNYAVNHGLIHANPIINIHKVFQKPKKQHQKTIKPCELPELMFAIANASIKRTTRCLIEFQLHTMTRPSEAAGARWDEIDFKKKLWIIPAERMKKRQDHKIPLSNQVMTLLEIMKAINGLSPYVFASVTDLNKPCHSQTANMALLRMGFNDRLVSHGLRSIASTTLNENGFEQRYVEAALSHVKKDQVEGAYNHAEYMEKRIEMMQWWSDHIEEAAKGNYSMAGMGQMSVIK